MKQSTIEVRGKKIELEYNDNSGLFGASIDGDYFEADTREGLRKKLDGAVKRRMAKISIPFVVLETDRYDENKGKLKVGTITGLHGNNRNYLVTWDKGQKAQVSSWELKGAVPLEKRAEFEPVVKAMLDAQKVYDAFISEHGINLEKEVDAIVRGQEEKES
jgi:hypothetical protein